MPDTLLHFSRHCHICAPGRAGCNPCASGYSRAMHKCLLFTLAVGTGGFALAQTMPPAGVERGAAVEVSNAQKRTELRNVLSAGRNGEAAAPAPDAAPTARQLSRQERAEMREQLRRFQPEAARPRQP
jgi:hypothetical protein